MRPEIAARYGGVEDSSGALVALLTVNGQFGDNARTVRVGTREAITLSLEPAPSGPSPARYALYVWEEEPDEATLRMQPFGLGTVGFPTPLSDRPGTPNLPIGVLKTIVGHDERIGRPRHPGGISPTPAPIELTLDNGIPFRRTLTVQALIEDSGSTADVPYSFTNAVVIEIGE